MSSATSTEESGLPAAAPSARGDDPGLHPWQFFLLAGMLSATGVVLIATGQSPGSIILLSLTVVAASLAALGTYRTFAPLVVPKAPETPPLIGTRTRAALEREKTLVLRAIKDLEFDFAMKKIAKPDFDELAARLRARAIGLMRQLDEGGGYRAEIERQIDARLAASGAPVIDRVTKAAAAAVPFEAAAMPTEESQRTVRAATVCECGTAIDADARFCKSCGNQLEVA